MIIKLEPLGHAPWYEDHELCTTTGKPDDECDCMGYWPGTDRPLCWTRWLEWA